MGQSIKNREADQLARELAFLTGETMTGAVTVAVRERLARERDARAAQANFPARIKAYSARLKAQFNVAPVSKAEFDNAWGEQE